jgi:5-methylcytosine-specific restriction endonuclease McrA
LQKTSKSTTRPKTGKSEKSKSNRTIPTDLKIRVWKRDHGKCTYIDPKSGRQCGSTSFIEIDHIIPHALGGKTTFENLRLYCKTHNLEAARRTYGEGKIQSEIRASGSAIVVQNQSQTQIQNEIRSLAFKESAQSVSPKH